MNIIRIRCRESLPAFKGQDVFTADEKTQIRMLPCGHFVVTVSGVSQLVPHSNVKVCDVELPVAPVAVAPEYTEEKRGPGRPKKEPVAP